MQELNFKLPFATIIPEFIQQFLSTEYIDQSSITCFELEDLREVILNTGMQGLDEIKKFLMIESEEAKEDLIDGETQLDYELLEVEDEYYHKYTPDELKFIFNKIIENIDELYDKFYEFFGLNMTYTIGFKTKENTEMNMVIEFLSTEQEPGFIKEAFYVNIENNKVSDEIVCFTYFIGENKELNEKILKNIINLIEFREDKN